MQAGLAEATAHVVPHWTGGFVRPNGAPSGPPVTGSRSRPTRQIGKRRDRAKTTPHGLRHRHRTGRQCFAVFWPATGAGLGNGTKSAAALRTAMIGKLRCRLVRRRRGVCHTAADGGQVAFEALRLDAVHLAIAPFELGWRGLPERVVAAARVIPTFEGEEGQARFSL